MAISTASDLAGVVGFVDKYFCDEPRFVTHIDDDRAIESLTTYYREELAALALRKNSDAGLLDLFSSWISHLPDDEIVPFKRVVGIGP